MTTLEKLGFVREDKQKEGLLAMSMPELIENFVLPQCLCLPRSGRRYPRIDGSFMALMARHGKDFLEADYEHGSVLLELAMQRITKNPELPAIDYRGILPAEYQPYSAASVNPNGYNYCPDEPGLWGAESVHFIVEMLPTCLGLGEPKYADHARLILFQILTKVTEHFFGMGVKYLGMGADELWKSALQMLNEAGLEDDFIDYCLKSKAGWRIGLKVFQNWDYPAGSLRRLVDGIDLDKEVYYKGFKRRLLKLFGLYNKMTRKRILEELIRA